jgi:concanavalin A-like lectin/glucanase superfamily protein
VGAGLAFDGVDDHVAVPHQAQLDSYPVTVGAWFRTTSAAGLEGIVNKYVAGSYDGYQVFLLNGNLCAWYIRDQVNHVYDGSDCTFNVAGLNDGQWHHAVFVVDPVGGRLYVDGLLKGSQPWTGAAGAVTTTQELRFGDYPGATGGGFFQGELDQLRIFSGALSTQQVVDLYNSDLSLDRIFGDGFESGTMAAWSTSAVDGGDLRVDSAGALASTSFGADALVDDVTSLFVQDNRPVDESRYRARFYVDPSRFDPGETNKSFRTRIFLALSEAPQRRLVAIVLRRMSGQYALMALVRTDDGTELTTPFATITPGSHAVEFDWRRSRAPGANDGSFQLWIDGTLKGSLTALDNDLDGVDLARLGALSLKSGASGTLYWDEFESRRRTYIGPRR